MLNIQFTIQKKLLAIVLNLIAISSYCQGIEDGENMYLYTKSTDEAAVYSLDEINKITFSKNGIQIWNTNWPTEYVFSNVRVLAFGEKSSSLETSLEFLSGEDVGIDITYNASIQTLTVSSGAVMRGVMVYNLKGLMMISDMIPKRVFRLQLSSLSEGVYIVKAFGDKGTMSKKIMK